MSGFIYAITNGLGAVKLGWSTDPQSRLRDLRTGHVETLVLLGVVPGTLKDEKGTQRRLGQYKIRGEWFRLEGEVEEFIKQMVPCPPAAEKSPKDNNGKPLPHVVPWDRPIDTWGDLIEYILYGHNQPLMHILGISKQGAHSMRTRVIIPPAHWNRLVAWGEENDKPLITYKLLGHLAANHPPRIAAE